MRVIDLINSTKSTTFSFEVLPPIKGNGIERIYNTVETLRDFDPKYINITTHRSEMVYKTIEDGLFKCVAERRRPGTVAIASAIKNKYNIAVVPHILCSGFSKEETEYVLIDLDFLGIHDLLVLRGDKAKHDSVFKPVANGYSHATELQKQINKFNDGFFEDGTKIKQEPMTKFSYGVAGYPEKHEESPNMESDINYLKQKVEAGAEYVVTQMFFDNKKYFEFVDRCRQEGINVPIIPGIKPITKLSQLNILPKTFHVDIPEEFASELRKCKTDAEAAEAGVEWGIKQAAELIAANVPSIHFYTMSDASSVKKIAQRVY